MSRLTANSLPAERANGCVFSETFVDSDKVTANGGTVTGSPTIDFGATLDGTNDYITYALAGNEFNSANISIVIEFYPDFDTDEDATRFFLDTDNAADRYAVYKASSADSNRLRLNLGNTSIASVEEATYSPYWNVGARNVLVVSGTSGDTSVWLNGNAILSNSATAWTPDDPINLYLGTNQSATSKFDGKITKVQVFQSLLTAQEALDIYNNATYNYENKAVLNLPMRMAEHDATNTQTLDRSGNGAHGDFNGSPTKQTTKGYDFDGTTDYLTGVATGIFNTAETSIVCEFYPDFATSENVWRHILSATDGANYNIGKSSNASGNLLRIILGNTTIASIAEATYSPYWYQYQKNVLVVSGTTGDTNVWLNGVQILANDNTAWTQDNPTTLYVGSWFDATGNFDGKISGLQVYQRLLTPTQVQDIFIRSNKQINDV